MNAILRAQNAYGREAQPIRTDRDTEYNAFAKITHQIKFSSLRGKEGFGDLANALYDNRKLWTILAVDAADKANPLPPELRARIIYLAEFTSQYSGKVLRREADVDALIDINTAMMRGLNAGGPRK